MTFVSTLLVALVILLAPPASASPENADDGCLQDEVCRSHYEHAVALFEQSHFDTALGEFQAAYAQRQMPWLLLNIGRTLHRLGRPKEALERYEMFSKAEPRMDAETRARLDKYIAQAQAQATVTAPASSTATSAPPLTTNLPTGATAPTDSAGKPLYKKWWFWTAIGGGVVVLVSAIAIGAAASGQNNSLPGGVKVYQPTF